MRRRVGWFGRFQQDPDQGTATAEAEVAELIGAIERRRGATWDMVRLLIDSGAAGEILRALAEPILGARTTRSLRWHVNTTR